MIPRGVILNEHNHTLKTKSGLSPDHTHTCTVRGARKDGQTGAPTAPLSVCVHWRASTEPLFTPLFININIVVFFLSPTWVSSPPRWRALNAVRRRAVARPALISGLGHHPHASIWGSLLVQKAYYSNVKMELMVCHTLSAQLFEKTRLKSSHVLLFGHFFRTLQNCPNYVLLRRSLRCQSMPQHLPPLFPESTQDLIVFRSFHCKQIRTSVF